MGKVKVVTREVKEKELDLEYPIFLHFQYESWSEELVAILDEKCKITVKYDMFGESIEYATKFLLEEHYVTNKTLTTKEYFYEVYENAIKSINNKLYNNE